MTDAVAIPILVLYNRILLVSPMNTAKRVLVVDDDPDILEAIKFILESDGYEAFTDSGDNIDKKLREYKPHLILLDVLLSGQDGREICRTLKHKETTKGIPIILISAHADAANSISVCGADDFIAKPFEMDAFLRKVKDYTEKHANASH
jgi:DNA-binding response OmpR family regulator